MSRGRLQTYLSSIRSMAGEMIWRCERSARARFDVVDHGGTLILLSSSFWRPLNSAWSFLSSMDFRRREQWPSA